MADEEQDATTTKSPAASDAAPAVLDPPEVLTGDLAANDANSALDELLKGDEKASSLDSILNTPAGADDGFNVDDHLKSYDAAIADTIHGTDASTKPQPNNGVYDSSGYHEVNPSGEIVGENNPAFGTLASNSNPNAFGSLARRQLGEEGIDTTGRRAFDFSGTNSQGKTIWRANQPTAPRQDLRFANFPKAPQALTKFSLPQNDTNNAALDQLDAKSRAAATESINLKPPTTQTRKRKLVPDYPGGVSYPASA